MKRYILFHLLTARGCSNLNSDKYGRPKTARHGDRTNIRISSQCYKRNVIRAALEDKGIPTSTNTTVMEPYIIEEFTKNGGIDKKVAKGYAKKIMANLFKEKKEEKKEDVEGGEEKKKGALLIRISTQEFDAISSLIKRIREGYEPKDEDFNIISLTNDADTSLFGRMNASFPEFNTEAAWKQNHPFTVNDSMVEVDYFTAVDDLKITGGAGHLNQKFFSDGIFYNFSVCDYDLLISNIMVGKENTKENNKRTEEIAYNILCCALEALAKRTPPAKTSNHADSFNYASYILIEKGPDQPRGFAEAFTDPVKGEGLMQQAIERIRKYQADNNEMERDEVQSIEYVKGEGNRQNFQALFDFLKI